MTRLPKEPSPESALRRSAQIDMWFDALWAAALGVVLVVSGSKFLHSAAWLRVLEWTPGGRATVTTVIVVCGLASLLLIATRWRILAIVAVSGWCFFVASFQVWSAFHDEAGPLGFFAWYYCSFQLLRHAFQNWKPLQ